MLLRWIACVAPLAMLAATPVARGQPLAESFWTQFGDSMNRGCLKKQAEDPATKMLKPAIVERTCACMAEQFVARAKASPEFLAAVRANDKPAMAKVLPAVATDANGRHVLMSCLNREMQAAGGVGEALSGEPVPSTLSKVPGLSGKYRASFVDEFVLACVEEDRTAQPSLPDDTRRGWCRCLGEEMADRYSESEAVALLRTSKPLESRQANEAVFRACKRRYGR